MTKHRGIRTTTPEGVEYIVIKNKKLKDEDRFGIRKKTIKITKNNENND